MNKDLKYYIIDNSMNLYTYKQEDIQQLLEDKELLSQLGNEDIVELLWEIICNFRYNDKIKLDYIIENLQEIRARMECEEE